MQSYIDVKYTPGSKNGVCKTVYQYDTGWKLRITALSEEAAVQIHYSIDGMPKAMMDVPEFETDSWVSNVPNALLAQSRPISVYIYVSPDEHSGQTMMHATISITPREKPDGYQYSEAEIQGFNYMLSQLEQAKEAVADSVKKTEESARQAEQAVQNANNAANAANEAAELINNMEFVGGEALENDESPRVTKSIIDGVLHLTFDIPVGDTGNIGPQGIPGGYYIPTVDENGMITFTPTEENMDIVDPMNIKGPKGEKGDPGKSLVIRSMYASYEDMVEAHPVGAAGDAYFVGTSESNVVYMWDEETSEWINIGSLRGPQGVEGGYYVPAVGDDGFIRWQGTKEGMPEIEAKNITGPQGEPGKDGKDGKSIAILGQYATYEDLVAAHRQGREGDMYAVGTPNNNVAYMWDETKQDWLCVGNLLGNVYVDPTDSNTSWMATPIDADTLGGLEADKYVKHTDLPQTYPPSSHNHTISNITNLQKELNSRIKSIQTTSGKLTPNASGEVVLPSATDITIKMNNKTYTPVDGMINLGTLGMEQIGPATTLINNGTFVQPYQFTKNPHDYLYIIGKCYGAYSAPVSIFENLEYGYMLLTIETCNRGNEEHGNFYVIDSAYPLQTTKILMRSSSETVRNKYIPMYAYHTRIAKAGSSPVTTEQKLSSSLTIGPFYGIKAI